MQATGGIISYHPDVRKWNRSKLEPMPQSNDGSGKGDAVEDTEHSEQESQCEVRVPAVHVKLLQSVNLLPKHETDVKVRLEGDYQPKIPVLVESDPQLETFGLQLDDSYVCPDGDGVTVLRLINPSGFTCRLEGASTVGSAEQANLTSEGDEDETVEGSFSELEQQPPTTHSEVNKVGNGAKWRKQKLYELYKDNVDLPQPMKESFFQFLSNHHEAFSLENERGETNLLEMEIDTGDAPPKKQRPRRVPFAVRQEISRQLRKMQEAQVIQPSMSPWASPVVLVRKRDGTH